MELALGSALLWTELCDCKPSLSSGSVFPHLKERMPVDLSDTTSGKMTGRLIIQLGAYVWKGLNMCC